MNKFYGTLKGNIQKRVTPGAMCKIRYCPDQFIGATVTMNNDCFIHYGLAGIVVGVASHSTDSVMVKWQNGDIDEALLANIKILSV